MSSRRLTALLLAGAALGLGACGNSSDDSASSSSSTTTSTEASAAPTTTATETTTAASSSSEKAVLPVSKDLAKQPKVPKPKGTPPSQLVTYDVVEGKGTAAKEGDTVSVQYLGVSWSTGKEFDSSWSRGKQPFDFPLGAGQVIPGWDQGVAGMKPGGRRELVIPADLAYGPQGSPPAIGPNETLVFVVDLEKVN
jgi:peptidylprolyl isomerase